MKIIKKEMIVKEDEKEVRRVAQILEKIEQIDEVYIGKESDVIYQHQPFIISLLLGYRMDLKELELEEVMKVILLIWEFFKDQKSVKSVRISESQFERVQRRNIHMLKYFEGEDEASMKMQLVSSDLENLTSKSLFTGVIAQFNNKQALQNMDKVTRGIVIVGLKSLIECFEELKG